MASQAVIYIFTVERNTRLGNGVVLCVMPFCVPSTASVITSGFILAKNLLGAVFVVQPSLRSLPSPAILEGMLEKSLFPALTVGKVLFAKTCLHIIGALTRGRKLSDAQYVMQHLFTTAASPNIL